MYTVIKFRKDYADEFDCEEVGLTKIPKDKVEEAIEETCGGKEGGTFHFGSNEGWGEYGDGVFPSDFFVFSISDEEAETLSGVLWNSPPPEVGVSTLGTGIIASALESKALDDKKYWFEEE